MLRSFGGVTFKMGAMKTERPVSRKTKMPVTLCSLGSEENKRIHYSKN